VVISDLVFIEIWTVISAVPPSFGCGTNLGEASL